MTDLQSSSVRISEHGSFVCYSEESFVGYWVASFTLSLGQCVWWAIKGLGYYDRQLAVFIVNLSWFAQWLFVFILQHVFEDERICGSRKNGSEVLWGTPSSEVYFFFSFVSFVVCFNYSRNATMQKSYLSGLLLLSILSVWAPWWTSNYTFLQVIIGAILGIVIGGSIALSIHYFWLEDFPAILEMKYIQKLGYYDSLCSGEPPKVTFGPALHELFLIEPKK